MVHETKRRLAELVSFPTVSAVSNLDLIAHVEALATASGAVTWRFSDPTGQKANLAMRIGPDAPGGIVLSGHTDVVPVTGQDWSGDPWTLRAAGDRVIARGATDMKGFLACCLAAMPEVARMPLRRPVWLAFSYDEEVGCTGVGPMAEWLGAAARPGLAVIGEPTEMELVTAHKGGTVGWVHVHGKPGHSSQPDRGVNAIPVAVRMVDDILAIEAAMRQGPLFDALDPPWSTIQVNQIEGGTAGNILAEHCAFLFEMRMVPGESSAPVVDRIRATALRLEAEMRKVAPSCSVRVDVEAEIPPLAKTADATVYDGLLGLLGQSKFHAVSYGTEAGIFADAGIPSVVCGPGHIRDAHQPDESIAVRELDACTDFLLRLAATCRD